METPTPGTALQFPEIKGHFSSHVERARTPEPRDPDWKSPRCVLQNEDSHGECGQMSTQLQKKENDTGINLLNSNVSCKKAA